MSEVNLSQLPTGDFFFHNKTLLELMNTIFFISVCCVLYEEGFYKTRLRSRQLFVSTSANFLVVKCRMIFKQTK